LKKEIQETRRPQFEQEQKQQLEQDKKTFAAAARELRLSLCDANFNLIRTTLGVGFTVQDIYDHPLIETVRATPQELNQWEQERIHARNGYLTNAHPQTLRTEAKQEAVANKQNHALTAFERELEAGLTREITNGGMSPLPEYWNGKRLDKDFIRRADKETLRQIMKKFGSSQLTARLHGITKIGNFSL
jgi:hypothetical protein